MVNGIYGSETTVIFKKNFSFCSKDKKPVLILHYSILTMLKMTYSFRNCKIAFLDCYQYSCCNQ